MKRLFLLMLMIVISLASFASVDVTSTGGTLSASYTTLKAAFDAINAGTHTGVIAIGISANTTETAPCVLNSSGAGSASYTSVYINPTADGVTVSGATTTGHGLIELKGADNVTIDGDNPGTTGINRNLTIANTAATTINYNSVIRICNAATVVASSDNNSFKNLILNGNVTGGNISSITSTSGSSNTSFGIYVGGNGGLTAIDAPTAITSVTSNTIPSGTTVNTLLINNNQINQCARAVVFNGAAATCSSGVTISNNLIGDQSSPAFAFPTTTPSTTVYTKGVSIAGTTAITINGNSIKNIMSYVGTAISGIELTGAIGTGTVAITGNTLADIILNASGSSSAARAISLASASGTFSISGNTISNVQGSSSAQPAGIYVSTSATSGTIDKNKVSQVYNRYASTYGSYGINLVGGNNLTCINNFIWDINSDFTGGGFSTTYGVIGLRIAGGTGHKVDHNTVSLSGAALGTGTAILTAACGITATTLTGIEMKNNIFSNVMTGGTTGAAHVSLWLPSSGTSAMNLSLNNNAYYCGTAANQGVGQNGSTAGTTFYVTLAAMKVYTATLSSAGTNDNLSFASTSAAPFTSATNLHIPAGTIGQLESAGATVGITTDIDGDTRPGPAGSTFGGASAPDIGADEFDGVPVDLIPPTITYTALPNTISLLARTLAVTITDASGVGAGANQPVLYWKKTGDVAYTGPVAPISIVGNVYTYTFGAGVAIGNTVSYFVVAQDIAPIPNIISYPVGATMTTSPPLASAPPASPSTYLILGTLCGNFTVGTSVVCDYPTLTAAIADLNAKQLCGPTTFTLKDASYSASETFPLVINSNPGSSAVNVVTFVPGAGVTATISGVATSPLLKVLTSYVVIDGSNAGGTDRSLTITNTSATTPTVLLIGSTGTTPITNVTVKNTVVVNGVNSSSAILVEDATAAAAGYFNNITLQNNSVTKAYIGIYCLATVAAGNGNGLLITGNALNGATTNAITGPAIYVQGVDGVQVTNNTISNGLNSSYTTNVVGVWFATGTKNGTISGNTISNLSYTGSSSYGANGILLTSGITGANITVSNNNITNLSTSTGFGIVTGIYVGGGALIEGVTITKNKISTLRQMYTGGYSAIGIFLYSTSNTSNVLCANNMIWDVAAYGYSSTTTDNASGIRLESGGGYNVYDNSVSMNTDGTSTSANPAALWINSGVSAAGAVDIRDNIFSNTTTIGASHYAVLCNSANTIFGAIDYNDYYTTGANLGYLGTATLDLAAWRTATGKDVKSVSGNPKFISASNLHIQTDQITVVSNAGTPLSVVLDDIDGDTRAVTPNLTDIGADEYTYIPPAVLPPTSVTAVATSATHIDVSYTINGNGNYVAIAWNTTGTFTAPTLAPPTVGSAFAGGTLLSYGTVSPIGQTCTPQTHYYYMLYSFDGTYYSSGVPVDAITPCGAFTGPFPFQESFDGTTFVPNCWAQIQTLGTGLWARSTSGSYPTTSPHSGAGMAYFNSFSFSAGTKAAMITPAITMPAGGYQVKFWMVRDAGESAYHDAINVYYNSTANMTGATLLGKIYRLKSDAPAETGADGWYQYTMTMPTTTGSTQYFIFEADGEFGDNMYLDDINIDAAPPCPAPTALTAVPGNTFANLGWTPGDGESNWDIEWGLSTYTHLGAGANTVSVNSGTPAPPYTLTGLTPVTAYKFYVRANCGSGLYSDWTGPFSFTTLVACPPPSNLLAKNITLTGATLGWTETGTATAWNIEWGLTGYTHLGAGATLVPVTSHPYVLSGLNSGTNYTFYVQSDCGGSQSTWSGPYNFTTVCGTYTAPFAEHFNSTIIPACWTNTTTPQSWLFTTDWPYYGASGVADHTGNGGSFAGVDGSGSAGITGITLTSPLINVSSLTSERLRFYLFNDNTSSTSLGDEQQLTVNLWNGTAWVPNIYQWAYGQNMAGWQEIIVNLVPYAPFSGPIQFQFVVDKGAVDPFYDDMIIDDIYVENVPPCPDPSALAAVPSTTTASLSWNANGTSAWDLEWKAGATFVQGTGTTITGVTNPYVLGGLSASTTYSYYVRANCGAHQSNWIGPFAFTTLCLPSSVPFAESFDGTTFAPTCWANVKTAGTGTGLWTRVTSGVDPTATTHSGAGMAEFNSFSYSAGTTGILVTPSLNIPTDQYVVDFWMFRDNLYAADADLVNVYYNNVTPDAVGATLLGTINRYYLGTPAEATANAWYNYKFNLPSGSSGNAFIVFEAVSQYGSNIFLDDVTVYLPLAHDIATLSVDMGALVAAGAVTPRATIKNNGLNDETSVPVTMTIGTYTSTVTVPAIAHGATLQVSFAPWTAVVGTYTAQACAALSTDMNTLNDCASKSITVEVLTPFYAYDAYDPAGLVPEGPVSFFREHPGSITSLAGTTSSEFISAGSWVNGTWYGSEYYDSTVPDGGGWWTISPTTGTMTQIAALGRSFNGIAYDHTANILYGVDGANLYKIVPATGVATLVGTLSTGGALCVNLATDGSGFLYSLGITSSTTEAHLWKIDPNAVGGPTATDIGTTGLILYYAQDMGYDYSSNTMYAPAYLYAGTSGLYTVNLTTGALTLVGSQNSNELDGLAIPYSSTKTLNLTSVFLEGAYTGLSTMMSAMDATYDEFGNITGVVPKWGAGIADHITVELHASTTHYDAGCDCQVSDYPTVIYPATDVPLSTTGTATVSIPGEYNGTYYLTIKQRNHIETVSALPLSFAGATISYAFNALTQAYDANMTTVLEADGETVSPPLIFGGDVNQDGQVEAEDMNEVGNDASFFVYGYVNTDVVPDAQVESSDINIVGNNASVFVYTHRPQ